MRRTPASRTGLRALACLSALALVAGCSGGGDEDPTSDEPTTTAEPTTEEPTTEEPTEPTSAPTSDDDADAAAPDFPGEAAESTGTGEAATELVLIDVRTGTHDGFDRVVLEFTGTGTPGWDVGYVPEAVTDGKGEVIDLAGDAVLDVVASETSFPTLEGDPYYDGPQQLDVDGEAVEAVYVDGAFEGLTHVMVGVDDAASVFRVFALTEPSRLVIDVAHD